MLSDKNILVVDDHAVVVKGVVFLLKAAFPGATFATAETHEQALQQAQERHPDYAIVDVELKQSTGLDLAPALRQICPDVKVIFHTMHEEPWVIKDLVQCNADGVVLKGEDPNELIVALETIEMGSRYYSVGFLALCNNDQQLTPRELEVLELLCLGYSSKDIAERLYVSKNTIEYHRKRMISILGARNIAHLAHLAVSRGFIPPQSE